MPIGRENLRSGAGRKRSVSESDGETLNSTLNPNNSLTNPISSDITTMGMDRCVSEPHINATGFIDDSYRNAGTQLHNRSNGGEPPVFNSDNPNPVNPNTFLIMKARIIEWERTCLTSDQSLDTILGKYNLLCEEVDKQSQNALLSGVDFAEIGNFRLLKEKLDVIRRSAIAKTTESEQHNQGIHQVDHPVFSNTLTPNIPQIPSNDRRFFQRDVMSTNEIRRGGGVDLSRIDTPRSRVNDKPYVMDLDQDTNIIESNLARQSVPGKSRLSNPNYQPSVALDYTQTLVNLLKSTPNLRENPILGFEIISKYTDNWIIRADLKVKKGNLRMNNLEDRFKEFSDTTARIDSVLDEMKTTITGLNERCAETWSAVIGVEGKCNKISDSLTKTKDDLDEKFKNLEEWLYNLKKNVRAEIPPELVDSVREVLNDSLVVVPGEGVDELRQEISRLKKTSHTDRYITEGLRKLVVDLKDQMDSNSYSQTQPQVNPLVIDPTINNDTVIPGNAPQNVLNDIQTSNSSLALHPSHSSVLSEGAFREREIVRKGIERVEKQIRQMIRVVLPVTPIDISLVKKCKTVDVPSIHAALSNIQKSLQKYVNFPGIDEEYCDSINVLLDEAETWCLKTEELYNKAEVHSINSSKGDAADVGIFSDNSEVTVFEFLETAEIAYLGWGNSIQKANRLYNRHLSDEIKSKLIDKSDSYSEMKDWLITNYGGASRIINDILNNLSNKQKPYNSNKSLKYSYYSTIMGALQRLEKLAKVSWINKNELEICLYSRGTLSSLAKLLLPKDYDNWIREMTRMSLDFNNPSGSATFQCLKSICTMERNANEASRNNEKTNSPRPPPKSKNSAVHKIREQESSNSEDESNSGSHAVSFHNKHWFDPALKFPCPIGNHKHELNNCAEFFAYNPIERWNKMEKGKVCYTCLKPKISCNSKRCSNEAAVPENLKCKECSNWASKQGLAGFNILFCKNKEHVSSRAAFSLLKKDMEKYIGKFGTSIVDSSIKFAVNYTFQINSVAPESSFGTGWDQEIWKTKPAPTINSETGARVKTKPEKIIPEIQEHSCYLMQTVRIGKTDTLVFFDTGANIHLIDGELAIKERLQQISNRPTSLSVVGGDRIKTDYGTYRFNLGPGAENQYHEITCSGIDSVTASFGKYDITEICQEFRDNAGPDEIDTPLPPTVGGAKVQLLLGIKNTNLDPVMIKRLPSGVAVYLSPFKDIFGSRIIFAGPHKIFTQGNKGIRSDVSHAIFFLQNSSLNDIEDETTELKPFSMITNKTIGSTIHPYPINEEDLRDVGGEAPVQLEDRIDNPEILNLLIDTRVHFCGVHKAAIPIARVREMLNLDGEDDAIATYRCKECAKCETCKLSPKRNAISMQETREQEMIEQSVRVDLDNKRVFATYPFLKDPVLFLTSKHNHTDNYKQALKVYITQCRKEDKVREGMREVHKDLVSKGFMCKLTDLGEEVQDFIKNAGFRHFNPWRLVMKADSVSTPVRMVVDPTMTYFNLILAKGENLLGMVFEIIIRARVFEYCWSSDISKLYNQLIMDKSALPYALFLFHHSLDPLIPPETWVMTRAWYGIVSTGNQAGFAIEKLMELSKDEFPEAEFPLKNNRYVDDILSGTDSTEERDKEINAVREVLAKGGFNLKFVVKSGDKPSEKASSDGESMKMLGYKWDTEKDTLSPGVGELNMNKKRRGEKKPNVNPVQSISDAEKLLATISLTRRMILAKVAEFWDPCGFWEPIKVQMKIAMLELAGIGWDEVLKSETQTTWREILKGFVDFPDIKIPRFSLPSIKKSLSKIRLICLSDAGKHAGGAAVYIGRKINIDTWSCSLLGAKSRMMSETIPRNELSAILLGTELTYSIKKALGDSVEEIIYATDSTIALSWCSNPNIKLRLYVYNRVTTILRLGEWTTGLDQIPLYHINGESNMADLLTKKHEIGIKDVSSGSSWIEGLEWMKRDLENMPLTVYNHLKVEKSIEDEVKLECCPEPFVSEFSITNSEEKKSDEFEPIHGAQFTCKDNEYDERSWRDGSSYTDELEWLNLDLSEENIKLAEEILREDKDLINLEFYDSKDCFFNNDSSEVDCKSYMISSPAVSKDVKVSYSKNTPGDNNIISSPSTVDLSPTEAKHSNEKDEENFFVAAVAAGRGSVNLLVDPIFWGWSKALRILGYIFAMKDIVKHKSHTEEKPNCDICRLGKDQWDPRTNQDRNELGFFRYESEVIRSSLKSKELSSFTELNGIYYDHGRLSAEFPFKTQDLDQVSFLDKQEIIGMKPVVLGDSPVLYAFVMFIHTKSNPHAGVECTVKEVCKKMRVISGLRNLIKKVSSSCLKCKLREKKMVELRMSFHPEPRTVLAPPFHSSMLDIAFSFKGQAYKRARTPVKIYAVVFVCLMSGATNIMASEGLETQDIINVIERHSCRYGIPSALYVDNGTQLKALKHASFSIRDLDNVVQDSMGIKIIVSNAKAHSERGRVERRIRTLRESLEKLGVQTSVPMTCIQWDCLFAKISNAIDNLPIARGDNSSATNLGYEIITPNRLKMGRNNCRSLEGAGIKLEMSSNFTRILERNRDVYKDWFTIFMDNVHMLGLRPKKWEKTSRLPVIDDVVLFVFNDSQYSKDVVEWKLGRIVSVSSRKVSILYSSGINKTISTLERSIRDISIVYSIGELMINTQEHFEACQNGVHC